ncbi:hypothetical protein RB195_025967 [Necator americanus]|uniref:Uncharacterized protein n=1 Tax=Necator americanus TaxID=51031 RepID=A0ABR1EUT8_NECAM
MYSLATYTYSDYTRYFLGQVVFGARSKRGLKGADMSVSIQDPRATPRHIADQLKRFVLLADVPQSNASYSPPSLTRASYTTERGTPGGMRRAKSESAMLGPESRYDRADAGVYSTESRTSSRAKVRSPSINGVIGDDVRDALSQFDYLNDYDNTSIRGREREASYHF